MRKQSLKISVKPEVLFWTITSSGWDENELISKLNISRTIYEGWKSGMVNPTMSQLEDLSKRTKRPLAAFFLPKPPTEYPKPKDYRMLPDKSGIFNRKTIFAIRKARSLQKISRELAINLNNEPISRIEDTSIREKPEVVANKYREIFGLTEERQRRFKDTYQLYNYLREALEKYNILCFQTSMPLEDARGFALADDSPEVIVVNSKDAVEARIFTLLHEFGHLLLGETSISIPDFTTTNTIERWCNLFAASFLLPKSVAQPLFSEHRTKLMESGTLTTLSKKYKVSKAMLLYNMTELNFITKRQFNEVLERPRRQIAEGKKRKGGSVPVDKRCLSEVGNKFVSQVAGNVDRNYITRSDALSYLSVKSKNLDKVLSKAKK